MNSTIKTWLYIIGGFILVGLVAFLAIQLLIVAIPVILILYVFFKIKGYLNKEKKSANNYNEKTYNNETISNYSQTNLDGDIIDVDYQDIKEN